MTHTAAEVQALKKASVPGLLPAIADRWSPRAFASQPVKPADLRLILEAARWAASSNNEQPWRFLVGLHDSETFAKIASALVPFNHAWASHAPVLILPFAVKTAHGGKTNHYALYDLGQAVAQLKIQAAALGIATHSMGGFDRDTTRLAFNLPEEEYQLGAVIALGYQAAPDALDQPLLERELAPRERKPLSEIALTALDKPFPL